MATVLARDVVVKDDGVAIVTTIEKSHTLSSTSIIAIPPLGDPQEEKRFWFQRGKAFNPDSIATQPSVFDDPETAVDFLPKPEWENFHRFDPQFRWTWREEYKVARKIDTRILLWVCIMLMCMELDRANLGRALTDNFLDDLGMTTNDYNYGNTIFKLAILCSEIPSQLVCKRVGPDRWIPVQMTLWSVVATSHFWLSGRTSFFVMRALLGVTQAGFIPQAVLYLSYFYKHHELSIRLGFFYTAMSGADVMASLLAYGILRMRGVQGLAGWRWLFLIEGLLTLILSAFAFPMMPKGPCHTASWFRGRKGWFTEREEMIMVNRTLREDPFKSSMHAREPLKVQSLLHCLKDYDLWPIFILGLVYWIPMTPPLQYLTLSLRNLGFDTFTANLMTLPFTGLHVITLLGITYLSEVFGEMTLTCMMAQIWALPPLIYLNVVDVGQVNRWALYTVTTILVGFPNVLPVQQGWASRNSNSVQGRTVSAATNSAFLQAGGIIGSNVYRDDDAPFYRRGNRHLLAILCMNVCLYLLTKWYYLWRNKQKAKRWDAMTEGEKVEYLANTKDEGNKRLDFRFQH